MFCAVRIWTEYEDLLLKTLLINISLELKVAMNHVTVKDPSFRYIYRLVTSSLTLNCVLEATTKQIQLENNF